MKPQRPCRVLIDDEPNSGAWNMAVDEVLLESAISVDVSTIRVYRWAEPTLSLGYFQKPAEISDDSELSTLPSIRRLSGGGAIVHHHEITYSIALARNQPAVQEPSRLYETVHSSVIDWLMHYRVHTAMRGTSLAAASATDEPFLCFSRGDANDVMLDGHKILGSAQRRRRGAVLQHGSLVLRTSPFAAEFPGLFDLCEKSELAETGIEAGEFATIILAGFTTESLRGSLTPKESTRAKQLERERYHSVDRN